MACTALLLFCTLCNNKLINLKSSLLLGGIEGVTTVLEWQQIIPSSPVALNSVKGHVWMFSLSYPS